MTQGKKIYIKVNKFPSHNLPLLVSLPPGMAYDDSHASLCNVLVLQNKEGYTRVFSMGFEMFEEEELWFLFNMSYHNKNKISPSM